MDSEQVRRLAIDYCLSNDLPLTQVDFFLSIDGEVTDSEYIKTFIYAYNLASGENKHAPQLIDEDRTSGAV